MNRCKGKSLLNEILVRNYNKWIDNNFHYYFNRKIKQKEIQSRRNQFDHFQYIFHLYQQTPLEQSLTNI